MKFAVIIKILQITGVRISTAQHYGISDIKGGFLFYCVCISVNGKREKTRTRRDAVRKIKPREERRTRMCISQVVRGCHFVVVGGCHVVSLLLNWRPLSSSLRGTTVADCRLVQPKDQAHFSPWPLKLRSLNLI